ncbi:MAG: alpha/beta hydrolase [Dehalococcoidia bacterium]
MKVLRNFIDTSFGQVHYRDIGSGIPIVLLHMTPGSSLIYQECLKELGVGGFHAIAMDTMGYGDSESIGENRTIDDFADTVISLIEILKLSEVILVGLSTGSIIAAAVAINRPDLIKKLVLVEPGVFNTPDRQKKGYFGTRPDLDKDGNYLQKRWLQISKGFGGNLTLNQAHVLFLDALRSTEHQHEAYQALIHYDLLNNLNKIHMPTMLMTGKLSNRTVPISIFLDGIKHSIHREIPNAANAPPLEKPIDFVENLIQWL